MRCNPFEDKFEVRTQHRHTGTELAQANQHTCKRRHATQQTHTHKHRHATCTGTPSLTKQLAQASTLTQAHILSLSMFVHTVQPSHTHTYTCVHSHTKHFRLDNNTTALGWPVKHDNDDVGLASTQHAYHNTQCLFEFNSAILSITCTLSMLCYAATEHYFGTFCGNVSSRSTRTENAPATRCTHRLHNNTKKKETNKTDF